MLVTAVTNIALLNSPVTYGGILLVALIVCLIVKEIISNHPNQKVAALHRSLRFMWVPLAMMTVIILGQQLYQMGIL